MTLISFLCHSSTRARRSIAGEQGKDMPSTRSRAASMHLTYRGGPYLKIGGQGSSQSDKTTLDRTTIQRRPAGTRVEFRDTHKAGCGQGKPFVTNFLVQNFD
ncbi:hypothetical protein K438DRAFT_1943606 [Mycena galopus ATCC 62051]|nr:hypothetical protein K438DRAFT_1943606 [Mycena galopus ATCC 62051]